MTDRQHTQSRDQDLMSQFEDPNEEHLDGQQHLMDHAMGEGDTDTIWRIWSSAISMAFAHFLELGHSEVRKVKQYGKPDIVRNKRTGWVD